MTTGLKIAFVIFVALAVFFVLVFTGVIRRREPPPPSVTIQFWGTNDSEDLWRDTIQAYTKEFDHVEIKYTEIPEETYEEFLINKLAEGKGPDIFMLKNSWIEKHKNKINPFPQALEDASGYYPKDFKRTFVDIAADDLITKDGDIIGMPFFIDTPVLLYNKDIFNSHKIAIPPKTWDEVVEVSRSLTELTEVGDIIRSGIAMGSATNVERFPEIISSLIFQAGDTIIDNQGIDLTSSAENALAFYTSFADPTKSHYSWNIRMKNSHDALADGTAAMAIGLSSDIARIKARNPHLNLGIAPFPQQKNANQPVVYGTYYFLAVSDTSDTRDEAWKFLLYAASETFVRSYLDASGRPPARRDIIQQGTQNPDLDIFYSQALIAKSWNIPDDRAVENLVREMIESVVLKTTTPARALTTFKQKLQFIVNR